MADSTEQLDVHGAQIADPAEEQPTLQQRLAAEVIGTFVLVFFGCGSLVYAQPRVTCRPRSVAVGLTFGMP